MTQDTKIKIWAIAISAATSMLVMILSFTLQASKEGSKGIEQKLEQKVDKVQYKEDCEKTNERLKNVENIYNVLGEIKEGQAEMRTDIKWLKEKEQNTK